MMYLPFLTVLMVMSGVPGLLLYTSPENFHTDIRTTAITMSAMAFILCWVSLFTFFRAEGIKRDARYDRDILDFWQNNPDYIVRVSPPGWIAYHRKRKILCEGKTFRECLSALQVMHNQTSRWSVDENMWDLKVGEKGLMEAVAKEADHDISAGIIERDSNEQK